MMQLEVNNSHNHISYYLCSIFLLHCKLYINAPYVCISCRGKHCSVFLMAYIFSPWFPQALVESIEKTSPKVSCFLAAYCEICLECT